jgi:hypothetical protein
LALTIPKLEIFLFSQHNSTGGGNLELRQTICIVFKEKIFSPVFDTIMYSFLHIFKNVLTNIATARCNFFLNCHLNIFAP